MIALYLNDRRVLLSKSRTFPLDSQNTSCPVSRITVFTLCVSRTQEKPTPTHHLPVSATRSHWSIERTRRTPALDAHLGQKGASFLGWIRHSLVKSVQISCGYPLCWTRQFCYESLATKVRLSLILVLDICQPWNKFSVDQKLLQSCPCVRDNRHNERETHEAVWGLYVLIYWQVN